MKVIIDVSSIVFRSFYGIPIIFDERGEPKNAVVGFLNKTKHLHKIYPDATYVACFDTPRSLNVRNKEQPDYKSNRRESPEHLHSQFKTVRRLCEALNMNVCESLGYEADDVMASLCEKTTDECVVVTGDKDMLQLLRHDHVSVYNPYMKRVLTREYVVEKYGVGPEHFDVYLALVGDAADNIRGIPRIGPKRAAKIIHQTSGNVEDICHVLKIPFDTLGHNLRMVRFYDCDATYVDKPLIYTDEYVRMIHDLDIK